MSARAAPGASLVYICCRASWPIQHRPATAPLHGRSFSNVVSGMARSLPSGGTGGPWVHRTSPAGRPGRTIQDVPGGPGTVPGHLSTGAEAAESRHEPGRRPRRRRCQRRGRPAGAPRAPSPHRLAAGGARRLLRRPPGPARREHQPRRAWSRTSSPPARGCSCSCGWSWSPTCCPTGTACRRGGAGGCRSAWSASCCSWSARPATPRSSATPTTARTRR